jgi:phospholipid transport system substrate-binding protein
MKFLVGLVLFLTLLSNVNANTELVKKNFLDAITAVETVVSDKSLSKELRNKKVISIVETQFDFELMAKLSVGRVWNTLDSEVQNKFVDLYVNRMKKSYSSKLDIYKNEKFIITKIDMPKDNRIFLESKLQGSSEDFDIVYKYYKPNIPIKNKKEWLVYDVEILGVSILKTDRAQFSEYLKTHSVSELMESMKE